MTWNSPHGRASALEPEILVLLPTVPLELVPNLERALLLDLPPANLLEGQPLTPLGGAFRDACLDDTP